MPELVVVTVFVAALFVTWRHDAYTAFGWIFLSTVVLVPLGVEINFPVMPEFSVRRAALLGLALGAVLTGRSGQLIPRWRWFDLLLVPAVLSFSISFGLATTFKGGVTRVAFLFFDWVLPYVIARALLDDAKHTRVALFPFVLSICVLAVLAALEARMGFRLGAYIWHVLAGTPVPTYFYDVGGAGGFGYRWGFLRAVAMRTHPILLGTFFATAAPLIALWGQLREGSRTPVRIALIFCVVGCVAALSRGPMLVLVGTAGLFSIIAFRMRVMGALLVLGVVVSIPFVWQALSHTIELISQDVEGATADSALYRLVLLVIYGGEDFGLFGNPGVVGATYNEAVSLDNGYLYLLITKGWSGATLIVSLMVTWFAVGWRRKKRLRGSNRKIALTTYAAHFSMVACLANTWFAPDLWPLFFVIGALSVNQASTAWFVPRRMPGTEKGRAHAEGDADERRGPTIAGAQDGVESSASPAISGSLARHILARRDRG